MLFFFPRGVLDEILTLTESGSEGFSSYSYNFMKKKKKKQQNNTKIKKKKKKKKKKQRIPFY